MHSICTTCMINPRATDLQKVMTWSIMTYLTTGGTPTVNGWNKTERTVRNWLETFIFRAIIDAVEICTASVLLV